MSSALLHLDQPRTVVIKNNHKAFTYRFRRLTAADWKKYYNGITSTTEIVNGEMRRVFDPNTALQELCEETLEHVDGYTAPGGASVETLDKWKMKLPIAHKIRAATVLTDVASDQPGDLSVITDLNEVQLAATWSADESGNMIRFLGLIHRFRHPSIDQLRRFNRESSRTLVVGGSRSGKTIWPGHQEVLAAFYDELIVSVDGYSLGISALTDQVDLIKREMDTHHKVAAARALFASGDDAEVQTAAGAQG